jgi:hypothetical protein
MNPYPFKLDPSRSDDRKILCRVCGLARYHYRRYLIARLRAARIMPEDGDAAIWRSLRPVRAQQLAERAAWRFHDIAQEHYRLYTVAANRFLQLD